MALRVPTELWAASLLAMLGVAPVACGGRGEESGADDTPDSGTIERGTAGASGTSGSGSGGTSQGTGGTSQGTGGAGAGNPFPCESPTPLLDASTGFLICANGVIVRPVVAQCPSALPRPDEVPNYEPESDTCRYDSDCTAGAHGYCARTPGYPYFNRCVYGCVQDADCNAGQICLCGDPVGNCMLATDCTSDADCGTGLHCAGVVGDCGAVIFACQTRADTCATDTDCTPNTCRVDVDAGGRACDPDAIASPPGTCGGGRPFLVGDLWRVAGVSERSDWCAKEIRPSLDLDPSLRARLSADFLRAAQLEHASVAAFSRFLLELLALGAPAELVAETIRALDDERRHAELCFALASAYAGRKLGPDELDLSGALPAPNLEHSVRTALLEGCVGETVAALQAAELSERVADPVLRSALAGIATDEKRHAELAFKFVKWALYRGGASVAEIVARQIEHSRVELASRARIEGDAMSDALVRDGVLSPRLASAVRVAALESVVLPALDALSRAVSEKRAA